MYLEISRTEKLRKDFSPGYVISTDPYDKEDTSLKVRAVVEPGTETSEQYCT